ncbi:MAG: hypothetical protein QXJ74_03830 [Nitrososphaera sp.]
MRKSQRQLILTAGVIGAVVAFAVLLVYPQIANASDIAFRQSWNAIAFETGDLTQEYQAHEGKWKAGGYSNEEMAGIVDDYRPRYQSLIARADAIDTPDKYAESRELLVKSIETEMISNDHFKNYLLTGDESELRKSEDLLSLSLKYSAEADAAVLAAG